MLGYLAIYLVHKLGDNLGGILEQNGRAKGQKAIIPLLQRVILLDIITALVKDKIYENLYGFYDVKREILYRLRMRISCLIQSLKRLGK